ncbi:hypothetical protein N2152v2_001368 [Parachlorella kessleri]
MEEEGLRPSEIEAGDLCEKDPRYAFVVAQLRLQRDALTVKKTATSLVRQSPDILFSAGHSNQDLYGAIDSYCVLAVGHEPLLELCYDPKLLPKKKVLCPCCRSGAKVQAKEYSPRIRRVATLNGVLYIQLQKLICNACPGKPGKGKGGGNGNTQFTGYSDDFVTAIRAMRGEGVAQLYLDALPAVLTNKGGVGKDLASFIIREFEANQPVQVNTYTSSTLQAHVELIM